MNPINTRIGLCATAAVLLAGRAFAVGDTVTNYFWANFAGQPGSTGSVNGVSIAARFNYPCGVAVDDTMNVYVADTDSHTIRKVTSTKVVTTLAGSAGFSGSADGANSGAQFNSPTSVATDGAGNVYVADYDNHTIRKVTQSGVVTTLAGSAGDPGSADGTNSAAQFNHPYGITADGAGNLFVADYDNHTIRKVTPSGVVTTLAGSPGVPGSAGGTGGAAQFESPTGVAVDGSGNVYVADAGNHSIRKVTPDGVVTTLAGNEAFPGSADGTGGAAQFYFPRSVAVDAEGNVFVTDTENSTIRKVTPDGVVTTVGGLAGNQGSADGTGSSARFNYPHGVAVDGDGNVYVADRFSHRISKGAVPKGSFEALPQPLSLKMKIGFAPGKLDSANLKGMITLPVGVDAIDVTAELSIGGVSVPFALNGKGSGSTGLSSLKVTRKGKPVSSNQLWQVSAKLRGDWDATWEGDGFINVTTNLTLSVPVLLLLDTDSTESFSIEKVLSYKGVAEKSGSAK